LIIDQEIKVKAMYRNIEHYKSIGYEINKGMQELSVKVEDLPINSHLKIKIRCDYCQCIFERSYRDHIKHQSKSSIKKDACKNCRGLKIKEHMLKTYGVESGIAFHYNFLEK